MSNYKKAYDTLQKAAATHQKFAAVSSNGQPVSSVLTHLRLPPHQTLLGVPDIMADECVVAAMAATEKDIAMACMSASTLLTTVYAVQVEKVLELVDIPRSADMLAVALHGYCIRIITSAGDPDTQAWHPCVSAIKAMFTDKFKAVRFEYTAHLDKEAKANAVITACADAEMVDANRPIEEIVSEKVNVTITGWLPLRSFPSMLSELSPRLFSIQRDPREEEEEEAPRSHRAPRAKQVKPVNATASSPKTAKLTQTTLPMAKKKATAEKKGKGAHNVADSNRRREAEEAGEGQRQGESQTRGGGGC
jgi:hypothetical protein